MGIRFTVETFRQFVDDQLAASSPETRERYVQLRAHYSKCVFPLLLFAMARRSTSLAAYAQYLIDNFPESIVHDGRIMGNENIRNTIDSICIGANNTAFLDSDPSARASIIMKAVATDLGLGLEAKDVFPRPLTDRPYGEPPENFEFSHAGIETLLQKEEEQVQRHFFALQEKYPDANNDYALLYIAKNITQDVSPIVTKAGNIEIQEIAALFATDTRFSEVVWRNGIRAALHAGKVMGTTHLFFLARVENTFGLKIGTLQDAFRETGKLSHIALRGELPGRPRMETGKFRWNYGRVR